VRFWIKQTPYIQHESALRLKMNLSFDTNVYETILSRITEAEVPFKVIDQIDRDLKRTHLTENISKDMGIKEMQ
jgi:hypothetical protein